MGWGEKMVTSLKAGPGSAGRAVTLEAEENGRVERGPVREGMRTWSVCEGQRQEHALKPHDVLLSSQHFAVHSHLLRDHRPLFTDETKSSLGKVCVPQLIGRSLLEKGSGKWSGDCRSYGEVDTSRGGS